MEEYAYVLDYLAQGLPGGDFTRRGSDRRGSDRAGPVCYAVGEDNFKFLLLKPKSGADIGLGDRVYIGKDKSQRKEIEMVRGRIGYDDLTSTAQTELKYAVDEIVKKDEARFMDFYNRADFINLRKHFLEELPGVGKKTVEEFIKAKKEQEGGVFKSYAELGEKVPLLNPPEKFIAARIMLELTDKGRRRYIFVYK